MSLRTCADCSTPYALELPACPHCGSASVVPESAPSRISSFVTLSCLECGSGPWTIRLDSRTSGLIELPTLACISCGSRVPVTWPPEEEPMSPKITVHGGATNAHGADVSPAADVSQPQVVAEDGLGRPTSVEPEDVQEADDVPAVESKPDLDSMTIAELRAEASSRGLPVYGTKAQVIERLQDADTAPDEPTE